MEWNAVSDVVPALSKEQDRPHAIGVEVLVYPYRHYPSDRPRIVIAYYGRRVCDVPSFYLYGSVISPTHWMALPELPELGGGL